jgi:hypothetical protein
MNTSPRAPRGQHEGQHEGQHVQDYQTLGGFGFLGSYAGSSLIEFISGNHYYNDNKFEVRAEIVRNDANARTQDFTGRLQQLWPF